MAVTLPEAPSAPSLTSTSRFIWHDLMSTDRERALAFYRDLLGWSVQSIDMGVMGEYQMLHSGTQPFGGAVGMEAEAGLPSHWISYVSCGDVDAVAAQAEQLGGKILHGPMDIPDVGRFAVALDPQGSAFSPMSALPGTPAAPDSPSGGVVPVGCPIWNELLTDDPGSATAFYTTLFGWDTQTMPMQDGGTYTLLGRGPETPHAGGLMKKPDMMPVSAWVVYFHVADAAGTAAKAEELGGTVLVPVFTVPEVGQIAWLQDPSGAVFAILQPAW